MSTSTAELFNTQRLLFDQTRPITEAGTAELPNDYYEHGWTIIDDIADERQALELQEQLINGIDKTRVPLHEHFHDRLQLAKADEIPVCDDVLASSYQVLHFDMGHPFVESHGQLFVSHVGLYLPESSTREITAQTRVVELASLLPTMEAKDVEARIKQYARDHGDGWADDSGKHNTYRLACFARLLDAMNDEPELSDQVDKTVSQWFQNEDKTDADSAFKNEAVFYANRGIDLTAVEHRIALQPGQLLLMDNMRVIHGRVGRRGAKELFNYMFGIESIEPADITALCQNIGRLLVS